MRTSPRRLLPAVLTTAALVLALGACTDDSTTDPDPAPSSGTPSASESPGDGDTTPAPSESPSDSPTDEPEDSSTAVPLYFVTDSPAGPRLVREFQRVTGDPLTEAARLVAGAGEPNDPDYRTLWPSVDIAAVTATDGVLLVELSGDGFTDAPDGMTRREARLAVQQLVHTLQGVQQERVPVVFDREDGLTTLFGLSTDREYDRGKALQVLNHVNITSPAEGDTIEGDSITVSGVANSFEANVICEVVRDGEVVETTPLTAEGWMEERLFPFEGEVSVGDAGPGEVELRCSTDDPSGGEEGPGAFTDTRHVTLR